MALKIYIAGPYTSDPAQGVHNAVAAADHVAELGMVPYVPHLSHLWHLISPHTYEFWLRQDLEWLCCCDAVLRLLGESPGADREVAAAKRIFLPVFETVGALQRWRDEMNGEHAEALVVTGE